MDVDAGLPEYNEDISAEEGVIVPGTINPLEDAAFANFSERISAMDRADPWDTEPYLCALQLLEEIVQSNEI